MAIKSSNRMPDNQRLATEQLWGKSLDYDSRLSWLENRYDENAPVSQIFDNFLKKSRTAFEWKSPIKYDSVHSRVYIEPNTLSKWNDAYSRRVDTWSAPLSYSSYTASLLYDSTDLGVDGSSQLYVVDSGIDHGGIGGLGDDDHTQYLLATGARIGASSQIQQFTNGVKTDLLQGITDSDVAIDLSPAENTIHIHPGYSSGNYYIVVYSESDDSANPRLYPNMDSSGKVGTSTNKWAEINAVTGTFSGNVTGLNLNISNWDTAYGWGNHAGLYDATGTAASVIATHESTYNHTNYNTAYTHSQGNGSDHSSVAQNTSDIATNTSSISQNTAHRTAEDAVTGLVNCDGAGNYTGITQLNFVL